MFSTGSSSVVQPGPSTIFAIMICRISMAVFPKEWERPDLWTWRVVQFVYSSSCIGSRTTSCSRFPYSNGSNDTLSYNCVNLLLGDLAARIHWKTHHVTRSIYHISNMYKAGPGHFSWVYSVHVSGSQVGSHVFEARLESVARVSDFQPSKRCRTQVEFLHQSQKWKLVVVLNPRKTGWFVPEPDC